MPHLHNFVKTHKKDIGISITVLVIVLFVWSGSVSDALHGAYEKERSIEVRDRNGELLQILPNQKGQYMTQATTSARVRELTIKKEDRFFYYHLGVNPISMLRSFFSLTFYHQHVGGSTITQQLVKNVLGHENDRTIKNKLIETAEAIALELHTSKEDILSMYLSSAYFGNQIEGFEGASQYYFRKPTSELTDGEIVRMLALLSAPSFDPYSAGNTLRAVNIGKRIGVSVITPYKPIPRSLKIIKKDPAMFELAGLEKFTDCRVDCRLTIDRELTAKIREVVNGQLDTKQFDSVSNAAVVVIKLGNKADNNHLLAVVGTPNPYGGGEGKQINMALAARPIGSTWKPFIYGKALEKGARPYTIIDDSEYRYEIGTGFAFYPKNYDGMYRGEVTLNYALSNSLNVPAVRALQFDEIGPFNTFMEDSLGLKPRQSLDTYQLSVALGGLEMDPLLLANYFTVFPREGILAPLDLIVNKPVDIPMASHQSAPKRIFNSTTTELLTKMLSDRLMGVEQFGLESNLNLPFSQYAVKTGTSYDYHDSWTVGYTRDAVVLVWIGNSNNKPMNLLTGARGAGKIWHDVVALLVARGDIVPADFRYNDIIDVATPEGNSFGLMGDDTLRARRIMKNEDIILEPHDNDILKFENNMSVPLRAERSLVWKLDKEVIGEGEKIFWSPEIPGDYVLTANEKNGTFVAILHIHIVK